MYIAFIDLTKAFHLYSRDGLFQILLKIRSPPKLHNLINHSMKTWRQQCGVLVQALSGISFSLLLRHTFVASPEVIYLHTRADGQLFHLAHIRARINICKNLIRDMLFADGATIIIHTEQWLSNWWTTFPKHARTVGSLPVWKKMTFIDRMGQNVELQPSTIDNYELKVVHKLTYLGSTISDNLSLDVEINKHIRKTLSTFTRLITPVWENASLTVKTKTAVYNACIIITLL